MPNASTPIRWLMLLLALLVCTVAEADEDEDVAEAAFMFNAAEKAYR